MATFDQSTSASGASGTTVALTLPSGATVGSLCLVFIHTDDLYTFTAPSSAWTSLETQGSDSRVQCWAKVVAQGDPGTVFTWTISGTTDSYTAFMCTYSNVPQGGLPVEAHGSTINHSTATVTAPTVTPKGINAVLVCCFTQDNSSTIPAASGMTQRAQLTASGGSFSGMQVCDLQLTTTSATGTKSVTASGSATDSTGISIVVQTTPSFQTDAVNGPDALIAAPVYRM